MGASVLEFSEYILEPLRKDEEIILYRRQPVNPAQVTRSSILVRAPLLPHPSPTSPRQIQHEYSLRSDCDGVYFRHKHDFRSSCTEREIWHLGRFGGDAVIDIMRTHPMVIIGGILQKNPFFVPPDEFLREFRQRRAGRSNSPAAA